MPSPPILIVGAGPTGLVLALWLAKTGTPFRVIDQNPGPGLASRAMVVHARTLEFYRQLGIADEVAAAGFRIDRVRLHDRSRVSGVVTLGDVGGGISPFPFVLSLPQDDHERILNARLREAGIPVEWNTALVRFQQDDHGVQAALRAPGGEESWSGAYLCGCDGAHSTVRHALGVGFPGEVYEQPFYVTDVEADGPWSDREFAAFFAGRIFCLAFPIRQPGMFRVIGLVPEALQERGDVQFDDLRGEIERLTGMRLSKVNWFSLYRVHHRVADRFRDGRVFLSGDAGHVHSPAGGQGMNTGIGDAVNLAWKLAAVVADRAHPRLLESYEPERIPFARSLVRTTDRLFEAVAGRGLFSRLVRSVILPRLLPLALRFSAARRAEFRLVSQVRITYRESPLSDGAAGHVRAGDRLPWVEGIDNFAPLQSLDWQIHVHGKAAAPLREYAQRAGLPLHEWPWTPAALASGLQRDALYLVRPDGHVGFARSEPEIEILQTYVSQLGLKTKLHDSPMNAD